jgi:hypothetical protein
MGHKQYGMTLRALGAAALLSGIAACGGEDRTVMSDPDDRITFELPAGWTEAPASSGTRFSPPSSSAIQVQVNTVSDSGRASLAERRDTWLDFQRRNGAQVHLEREWPGDNLPGVEYAHDSEGVTGERISHHILLAGDGYVVTTYLQAPRGLYEDVLPTYRSIVASVEPAGAD